MKVYLIGDESVLAECHVEGERLPAVGKEHRGPRAEKQERLVDGRVIGVGVVEFLVRSIRGGEGEHRGGHAMAHRGGRVAFGRGDRRIVAQGDQLRIERRQGARGTDRLAVAMSQDAVGCVADGLPPRGGDIWRRGLFAMEVADGDLVIGRPGVPHGHGSVEKIVCMNRRIGEIDPNGRQIFFVPMPRHRFRMHRRVKASHPYEKGTEK